MNATLRRWLWWVVATSALLLALTLSIGALLLGTLPGSQWTVRLPLVGGASLNLPVPGIIRLATSPRGLQLLDGRYLESRYGPIFFQRDGHSLTVHCSPCRLPAKELASTPLAFRHAMITIARHTAHVEEHVNGRIYLDGTHIEYSGRLTRDALEIDWKMPHTDIATVYRTLQSVIPEVRVATIIGTVDASGTLGLPSRSWTAQLNPEDFAVSGLGTERLANGGFIHSCHNGSHPAKQRRTGDGERDWTSTPALGRWLPAAVLAAEDARFYTHPGYDLEELAPLLRANHRGEKQEMPRGGSTLTQQLAKNFFTGGERTFTRKLRELLYTVEMEGTLGKTRVLTLYLNTADWGDGICGAKAAARHYFNREPKMLTAAQAAWLAAQLHNPRHFPAGESLAEIGRVRWVISRLPVARQEKQRALKEGAAIATPRV